MKHDPAPLARGADRRCARGGVGRAIHRALHAKAAGQLLHLRHIVRRRKPAPHRKGQDRAPVFMRSRTTSMPMILLRAELAAERAGGQAHRAQPGNQHRVIAVDADLLQPLVDRAESAGHLRAIGVGELSRAARSDPSLRRSCTRPCRRRAASRKRGDTSRWCRRSCSRAGNRCRLRSRRCDKQSRGRPS